MGAGSTESQHIGSDLASNLDDVRRDVYLGDLDRALRQLEQLEQRVQQGQAAGLDPWRAEDLEILLAKLARRIRLVQTGVIKLSDLG